MLNFHGLLGGVISQSFVLSRNLPKTPIRAIVNDRPSRLFSAQQEALQRSLGWPLSSRHLSSPIRHPAFVICHPAFVICHPAFVICHFSIPRSAFEGFTFRREDMYD